METQLQKVSDCHAQLGHDFADGVLSLIKLGYELTVVDNSHYDMSGIAIFPLYDSNDMPVFYYEY